MYTTFQLHYLGRILGPMNCSSKEGSHTTPQYTCLCSTCRLNCNVAAAQVGSLCSSRSRFNRLAEVEEEEEGRGVEEAICL